MKTRVLGKTGIEISEIGFGAWGIGGQTAGATSYGHTDDAVSVSALKMAFERGITIYDTANVYGNGHSEELIGQAFKTCRDRVVLATKAGMQDFHSPTDFRPESLRNSLEQSLRRLKTDYVDVFQLHNPTIDQIREHPEIIECLQDMRSSGLIRAFGFSLKNPEEGIQAINEFDAAILQVNLNMMDLRAYESGLLDLAAKTGTAIMARTPLHFGFLSGAVDETMEFKSNDHRSAWPRETIEKWSEIARCLRKKISAYQSASPECVALRYCLTFDAVSCVLPGMLTPQEVVMNVAASDMAQLSGCDIKAVFEINVSRMDCEITKSLSKNN